jgi:hypothetical protein
VMEEGSRIGRVLVLISDMGESVSQADIKNSYDG